MSYFPESIPGFFGMPVDFKDKKGSVRYYMRYMFARTQSIFEYEGLPDTIPARNLELLLQATGFACITKVEGELYALTGGLGGEPNAYYMPTLCVVANPYLRFNKQLKIDEECVIVPNDAMYLGLSPMFARYATALAENDLTIRIADINARLSALITASTDSAAKSARQFVSDLERGELGTIETGTALFEGVHAQPLSAEGGVNRISQLIELQQYLKASWYNDLGLSANYNMKREAINSTEAQLGEDALLPFIDNMLKTRQIGIEKVNKMYGTNISVRLSSAWEDREEIASAKNEEEKEGVAIARTETDDALESVS